MSYILKSCVYTVSGNHWLVNAKPSGLYSGALKAMIGQLEAMESHYSRVIMVRFDLLPIGNPNDNSAISKFFNAVNKKLAAKYKLVRMGYAWCREMGKTRVHYHCAAFIDGSKINYPKKVLRILSRIWLKFGQKFNRVKNCYYFIDNFEEKKNAIYRLSYLAKVHSKKTRSKTTHRYGTSRIELNPTKSVNNSIRIY